MLKPVWRLNRLLIGVVTTLLFFAGFVVPANAAINEEITFYGNLKDASDVPLSGTYDMVFRFYDAASGGTLLDTSTHTTANGNPVTVDEGEFIVRLGSGTGNALDGIDFNTPSIYVGLTVGSDSEMTPRSKLTAAAYAFNSDTLDGLDSTQLVRSDTSTAITASSASTLLSLTQSGAGDILNIFDGATEVFTVADGGSVGVGTTTPYADFSVDGDMAVTGGIYDNSASLGVNGYVLQSDGAGVNWVATSSLGINGTLSNDAVTPDYILSTGQADEFCLTYESTGDTWEWQSCAGGSSLFTDGGATTYLTSLTDNLAIGGATGSAKLTVYGDINIASSTGSLQFAGVDVLYASTTSKSISVGEEAGQYFGPGSIYNVALGFQALKGSSTLTMTGDFNTALGASSGFENTTGYSNTFLGSATGYSNTTGFSNEFIGDSAGYSNISGSQNIYIGNAAASSNTTGTGNIVLGYQAADNLTSGSNNIVIGYDVDARAVGSNYTLNIGNILFGTDVDGTGTTLSSGNIGVSTSTPFAKLSVDGDLALTGGIFDNTATRGTDGYVLQTTGSGVSWVATSTLGLASATSSLFEDSGATTYLKSTDNFAIGTTSTAHDFSVYRTFGADMSVVSGSTGNADISLYGYRLNDNNPLAQVTGYNLGTDDVARIAFYRDGNDDAGRIRFYTQPNGGGVTERMVISSAGFVGIATSSPVQTLQVFGDIRVGDTGSNGCIEDYGGGVIGGSCSSDERLKTDILSIEDDDSYLERLVALTPVTYKWNDVAADLYNKNTDIENLGLIAQDVERQFPELVTEDDEGYRQVDFRALPFYIIEAIKELWREVSNQENRLESLERENERLKQRLIEIESELDIEKLRPQEAVSDSDESPPQSENEVVEEERGETPVDLSESESESEVIEESEEESGVFSEVEEEPGTEPDVPESEPDLAEEPEEDSV